MPLHELFIHQWRHKLTNIDIDWGWTFHEPADEMLSMAHLYNSVVVRKRMHMLSTKN